MADLQLDEEGQAMKEESPEDREGVLIVEAPSNRPSSPTAPNMPPSATAHESKPREDSSTTKKPRAGISRTKTGAMPAGSPHPSGKQFKNPPPDTPQPSAKPAKPRVRLNPRTGSLDPVDDGPGLF
jgi:hypothetical protein